MLSPVYFVSSYFQVSVTHRRHARACTDDVGAEELLERWPYCTDLLFLFSGVDLRRHPSTCVCVCVRVDSAVRPWFRCFAQEYQPGLFSTDLKVTSDPARRVSVSYSGVGRSAGLFLFHHRASPSDREPWCASLGGRDTHRPHLAEIRPALSSSPTSAHRPHVRAGIVHPEMRVRVRARRARDGWRWWWGEWESLSELFWPGCQSTVSVSRSVSVPCLRSARIVISCGIALRAASSNPLNQSP
jgi:hypothetical protein